MLLAPQNPFYVLQAAETAYTAQDIPLALRFFLMTTEMVDDDDDCDKPPAPTGIAIRAWYGVELVSFSGLLCDLLTKCFPIVQSAARLEADQRLATSSPSNTRPPEHLSQLRQLAQDVIKTAQAGQQDAESAASSAWLSR
jgi:ER membrane protein complex subunit 2